jgi:hypothetical protein
MNNTQATAPMSLWRHARTAILFSALLLPACTAPSQPPRQVQASNPTVTYQYRGDQELLNANQRAMNFCSQYQLGARTGAIVDTPDGGKAATFECVAMASSNMPMSTVPPATMAPVVAPNVSYTYRTEQEMMDGTRNADSYCMSRSGQRAMSNMVQNPDGTRTLTFQCVTR